MHAGSDDPDAALLLLARTGFVAGTDKRFAQTIEAIRAELSAGPLLYRLSGSRSVEGTFVACSFWLVDVLVRSGHDDEAGKPWRELTGYASDLGLFAEEIDPSSGAFLVYRIPYQTLRDHVTPGHGGRACFPSAARGTGSPGAVRESGGSP